MKLSFFCVVRGQDPSYAFKVEIDSDKDVYDLKTLIKLYKPNDFNRVDANNLTLWKVDILFKDGTSSGLREKLINPAKELGELFPSTPSAKHIHILVEPSDLTKHKCIKTF